MSFGRRNTDWQAWGTAPQACDGANGAKKQRA